MCNCIVDISAKIKEKFADKLKKPIEKVEPRDLVFRLSEGTVTTRMVSYFDIALVGQKKKHPVSLHHSYCPFCGEKIESVG